MKRVSNTLQFQEHSADHAANPAWMEAIINNSLQRIMVLKAIREKGIIIDFEYVFVNKRIEESIGRSDLYGKSLLNEYPGAKNSGLFDQYKVVAETGIPLEDEIYYGADGLETWSYLKCTRLGDGCLVIYDDITERKKAQLEVLRLKDELARKASDQYLTLFNSIDQGFCIIEMIYNEKGIAVDYRFLEVNPALEKQTGVKHAVGKTIRQLVTNVEDSWLQLYDRVAKTGESIHFENSTAYLVNRDWYDVYAFRVENAERPQVAVLFKDITAQKRHEKYQEYLLKLTDTLRSITDANAIQHQATQLLGEELGVIRAFYFNVEKEGDQYFHVISQDYYCRPEMPSLVGRHPLTAYGESIFKSLAQGEVLIMNDIHKLSGVNSQELELYLSFGVQAMVCVPLFNNGQYMAGFSVNNQSSREWTNEEIQLIKETAERTWAAVERARIENALRKSEEKFRKVFESIDEGFSTIQMLYDENGKPVDWIYLEVNPTFERICGFNPVGKKGSEMLFVIEEFWLSICDQVAKTHIPQRAENFAQATNRWYNIHVSPFAQTDDKVVVIFDDITERKNAELALRVSEERFKILHESLRDSFVIVNMQGNIIEFNNIFCQMIGYTPDETRKLTYQQLTLPKWHAFEERIVQEEIIPRGYSQVYEKEYRKKDGSIIPVELRTILLRDKEGNPESMWAIIRDISKRKKAEQALKESNQGKTFLLQLSDALRTATDLEEIQTIVTRTALHYFKADRCFYCEIDGDQAIIRQDALREDLTSVADVYPIDNMPIFKAIVDAGYPIVVTDTTAAEIMDENLRQRCLQLQIISYIDVPVIFNHKAVGILSITQCHPREWTDFEVELAMEIADRAWSAIERAKAEQQLKELNESLMLNRKEIEASYQKEITINEELRRINQMMDTFVYAAAHDLKAPISNLKLLTELINDTEDAEEKLQLQVKYPMILKTLDQIISGLISVLAIEKNPGSLKVLEFQEVYQEVCNELSSKIMEANPEFIVDFSGCASVIYIESYLVSIFRNMISNALKYRSKERKLTIGIQATHLEDCILLTFKDNGIGIDLNTFGNDIFKPFKRFNQHTEGAGIGLHLIRNIVTKNGGKIDIDSKVGKGTTFNVYLFPYH